jgi:hypothetical protein
VVDSTPPPATANAIAWASVVIMIGLTLTWFAMMMKGGG